MIETLKINEHFRNLIGLIRKMREDISAAGVILFPEVAFDWARLRKVVEDDRKMIIASMRNELLLGAAEHGFPTIRIHNEPGTPIHEKISHAVLEAIADDLIPHGSRVISLYSAFDPSILDSISVIDLNEHLERLSGRDLRQLESCVPLKTLKTVVDLAVDIGWEGREGKAVGTLIVVGDTRRVLTLSKPVGFDPVRGYQRKERTLFDSKVREGIKEIAQLDGAILVSADGTVEAACRYLESSSTATISLSLGLGARHWAAAAISRTTSAIAIAVSQSSGTVRIFQNGEVALRIESRHRKPMVWRDFEQISDDDK